MTSGLQLFDVDGNIIFDTNDELYRFIGWVDTTSSSSGSLSVPAFSEGTPWFVTQANVFPNFSPVAYPKPLAIPWIVGTTIYWGADQRSTRIFYGIY